MLDYKFDDRDEAVEVLGQIGYDVLGSGGIVPRGKANYPSRMVGGEEKPYSIGLVLPSGQVRATPHLESDLRYEREGLDEALDLYFDG